MTCSSGITNGITMAFLFNFVVVLVSETLYKLDDVICSPGITGGSASLYGPALTDLKDIKLRLVRQFLLNPHYKKYDFK